MDGNKEKLEEMEPEEMERSISEAKGWASGYYDTIRSLRHGYQITTD